MDRDGLLDEIAVLSAEEFATFQRELRARRTKLLRLHLETLSTPELQARGQLFLEQMKVAINVQKGT